MATSNNKMNNRDVNIRVDPLKVSDTIKLSSNINKKVMEFIKSFCHIIIFI